MKDIYVTMYEPNLTIMAGSEYITLEKGELVSISFIHNYDTATYPIIRLRIYADLIKIQTICEHPDELYVVGMLHGGIYKMNDEESTPVMVKAATNIPFTFNGYIESKNIASSTFDQYENGIKRKTDLNDGVKCPLEIYCYDYDTIHNMKKVTKSVYKNTTVGTVIDDLLIDANVRGTVLHPITNAMRHDQILIPNMDVIQAFSYIDQKYGLYKKGGMLYYGSGNSLFLMNTDVNCLVDNKITPIYVESYKNSSDMSGMTVINDKYCMKTMASNVSVISESDIERVLHGPRLAAINLNDINDIDIVELTNLFEDVAKGLDIEVPNLLHKTKNEGIATSFIARLDERITKVDVSGFGFDISMIQPYSRFNLIFGTPIRGLKMNKLYRPTYACHVLSATDTGMYIAQTTMNLCTN